MGSALTLPVVDSVTVLANVTAPLLTRDSCGSVKIGDRILWTCRDTEPYNPSTGQGSLPLITNTASWTDLNSDGSPAIQIGGTIGAGSTGTNDILLMYGGAPTSLPAFYPVPGDSCPESGACSDGTRYAVWPNSPPLITSTATDGSVVGYTWIPLAHLSGLSLVTPNPQTMLYKMTYSPNSDHNVLPSVTLVDEAFWPQGTVNFGSYGGMVENGTVYLYGQNDNSQTLLAKVPAASVEDKTKYQFYINNTWSEAGIAPPSVTDTDSVIDNAGAGGQGTFYYSEHFAEYVWIGQAAISNQADFYITVASKPEGPWEKPYLLYKGANGDNGIAGGYTLQAHPSLLSSANESGIYISWTKQFESSTYGAYITPLAYVKWSN